ncbi:MAG: ABC transporter permease [Bacillota bacterium]|jgi:ribose transport system permease protein
MMNNQPANQTDRNYLTKIFVKQYAARILLIAVLLTMMTILTFSSEYFLTLKNIKNILNLASTYILLSVGMTFVICSGGIDLSVGAIMAMSSVIMGFAMKAGIPVGPAVLFGLISGTLIGAANGFLISKVGINALIVTLSMMSIVRGSVILLTDGKPVFGFDSSFTFWGGADSIFRPLGWEGSLVNIVNPPIALALLVTFLGWIVLEKTKLGRYCFVLGSNESALQKTGVNTLFYKVLIYALSGLCAAITGFIVAARLNTCEPLAGTGYEMDAIAAVVLGGTLIQGGSGSISGTFIACLILAVMRNGLTILSISSNYQQLLTGLIVMTAVAISEIKRRKG